MTTTFSFSFTLFLLQSLQTLVELINPWWRCADRGSAFLYTLIVPVRLRLRIILILRGVWVCVTESVTLDSCLLVSVLLWSCFPVCSGLVVDYCHIQLRPLYVERVNVLCLQCCWLSQVLLNQLTAASKTIPIKPDINMACYGFNIDRLNKWACNILKETTCSLKSKNIIKYFGGFFWKLGKPHPVKHAI